MMVYNVDIQFNFSPSSPNELILHFLSKSNRVLDVFARVHRKPTRF